jgi:Rrf2 family transcriptional regulator, iron-sulfur cluster assembly transcription factor
MRLTTKGRFAVTAMLDLAMHEHDKPVTLSVSAKAYRFPISNNYSAACAVTAW